MLERISSVLSYKCLVAKDQPLLVSISGGPDSLCLLDILHRLDYRIIVAHYDHMLRENSSSEAEEVRKLSTEMGLTFILGQEDVKSFAEQNRLSLEEAARILRYKFLFQQAESYHAQAVAVGHTANDQVETLLMHLLRGAGLSGLSGMSHYSLPNTWSQSIPLVRPMLGVWRDEIQNYLNQRNLIPALDKSNLDTRFYRNRLRHVIIPYLENIQPHFSRKLWQTAEILREDSLVLEHLTNKAWEKCVLTEGPDYLALSPSCFQDLPLGLQRRLLRKGISKLHPGLRDVNYETIERGLTFINNPSICRRIDLVAGLYLLHEKSEILDDAYKVTGFIESNARIENHLRLKERVWLATWGADLPNVEWPRLNSNAEIELTIPGETLLENEWRISTERLEGVERNFMAAWENQDPFQAYLDLDSLELPLFIRTRRPGDRLQLFGMEKGSVKVSDLMINYKIPHRAREGWPLIISGSEIAWVPGIRIAQGFQIKVTTKNILHLRILYQYSSRNSDELV